MIIIPSMPTQFRPLPQLEIQLNLPELRALAFVLDRVLSLESPQAGLCFSVDRKLHEYTLGPKRMYVAYQFMKAISKGMNTPKENTYHRYLGSYISKGLNESITVKELAAIRTAWARHIARSIYEQIGD